eukprot:TRINITY_DN8516_c0_g1_i6.p1 TRINITY_DN8516_c0_g1~~TRINITY_DN8516_c0_g1_i6.p1  ORF type:complete len:253 (+),score=50.12 TRINITY_DN8516_c0_g1_i6:50-808(+)
MSDGKESTCSSSGTKPPKLPRPTVRSETITKVGASELKEMQKLFKDCDEGTCRRFLAARDGNVKKGSQMLKTHQAWAQKTLPIDKHEVKKMRRKMKFFTRGYDKDGHPILHFIGPHHSSKDELDQTIKMMTYVLEDCVAHLPRGIEKFTLMLFLPTGSEMDRGLVQAASKLFGDNYPERMHKCLVFPTGMLSRGIWSVAKSFLDPVTAGKVHLLSGGRQPPDLLKFVDKSNLPQLYGGTDVFNPCPDLKPKK